MKGRLRCQHFILIITFLVNPCNSVPLNKFGFCWEPDQSRAFSESLMIEQQQQKKKTLVLCSCPGTDLARPSLRTWKELRFWLLGTCFFLKRLMLSVTRPLHIGLRCLWVILCSPCAMWIDYVSPVVWWLLLTLSYFSSENNI